MSSRLTESIVEEAALDWLEGLGWTVKHGPEIAPGELFAERRDYAQVVLERRLRDVLARLNPKLPAEALEDAFRKVIRLDGATLEARNRAVHRLLVDGVEVEYRVPNGAIRGAQARVIDFDEPTNNDWLAVNQFSVTGKKHTRRALIELKNAADENAAIWSAWSTKPQTRPDYATGRHVTTQSGG